MLHLDPADHYGSQWASHSLDALLAWAGAAAKPPDAGNEQTQLQTYADLASLPTAPGTASEAGGSRTLLAVPSLAGVLVH